MTIQAAQKYAKPKMICPFCQERKADGTFRAFSVNGMSMHVRQIHPEHYDEYQTHRKEYMERFACDNDGALITPALKEVTTKPPEAVLGRDEVSEQKYAELEDTTPSAALPIVEKPAEPVLPQKEEFRYEQEPRRREYNPYANGY